MWESKSQEVQENGEKKLGIRAAEKHSKNPFLEGATTTIKGRKKFYNVIAKGDQILTREGEVKPFEGVEHKVVKLVDDAEFVKVFATGVAGIYDLNAPGKKVFGFLLEMVQQNPNTDRIFLHFMDALEEPWKISKPVFFRGMAELIDKNFVAPSDRQNMFFLNPLMVWNGDRFRFVTEYARESAREAKAAANAAKEQQLLDAAK